MPRSEPVLYAAFEYLRSKFQQHLYIDRYSCNPLTNRPSLKGSICLTRWYLRPSNSRFFVMPDTAASVVMCNFPHITKGGLSMDTQKQDVATLIELLKMAAERWPHSEADQVSQSELFREDHSLLEMWPEACRRTGVGRREFPPGVIELWKQRLGRAN